MQLKFCLSMDAGKQKRALGRRHQPQDIDWADPSIMSKLEGEWSEADSGFKADQVATRSRANSTGLGRVFPKLHQKDWTENRGGVRNDREGPLESEVPWEGERSNWEGTHARGEAWLLFGKEIIVKEDPERPLKEACRTLIVG